MRWCFSDVKLILLDEFLNWFLLIDIKYVVFKFWYLLWDNNLFLSLVISGLLYMYSCKENNKINLCKSCVGYVIIFL